MLLEMLVKVTQPQLNSLNIHFVSGCAVEEMLINTSFQTNSEQYEGQGKTGMAFRE